MVRLHVFSLWYKNVHENIYKVFFGFNMLCVKIHTHVTVICSCFISDEHTRLIFHRKHLKKSFMNFLLEIYICIQLEAK